MNINAILAQLMAAKANRGSGSSGLSGLSMGYEPQPVVDSPIPEATRDRLPAPLPALDAGPGPGQAQIPTTTRSTHPTNPTNQPRPGQDARRHRDTILAWLLHLGRAVVERKRDGAWLGVEAIADIILNTLDLDLPGASMDQNWENPRVWHSILKSLGRRLSQCLGGQSSLVVEGILVERQSQVIRSVRHGDRVAHRFRFSVASTAG